MGHFQERPVTGLKITSYIYHRCTGTIFWTSDLTLVNVKMFLLCFHIYVPAVTWTVAFIEIKVDCLQHGLLIWGPIHQYRCFPLDTRMRLQWFHTPVSHPTRNRQVRVPGQSELDEFTMGSCLAFVETEDLVWPCEVKQEHVEKNEPEKDSLLYCKIRSCQLTDMISGAWA